MLFGSSPLSQLALTTQLQWPLPFSSVLARERNYLLHGMPWLFLNKQKSKQIRNCRVNNEVPPPSSQAYIQKEHLWSAGCVFLLQSYITSLFTCVYIYILRLTQSSLILYVFFSSRVLFFPFNHRSKSTFSVHMLSCFYLPWLSPSSGRVYKFMWKCVFTSLRYILSSGIAGCMVTQWLTFWGTAKCLPYGCSILQSHGQCVRAPVTPRPHWCLLFCIFG